MVFANWLTHQGRIQKIQKEGAESPTPALFEWKLHFSGDGAYNIVGVYLVQSKER